jgi:tRNA A-37 threonylcarbamoyl transferase component Bud32
MRWAADGHQTALGALLPILDPEAYPCVPGFAPVSPPRPMRVVLAGHLPGPDGPVRVAVKWQRPRRLADRAARRLRGGKGAREGQVLRALAEAGLTVPEVLAYAGTPDVLITRWRDDLRPLPAADAAPPALVRRLAAVLAAAHRAGLDARDLHAANLALGGTPGPDEEIVLVDLGRARIARPDLVTALGRHAHALLRGARRAQRWRALLAFCTALEPQRGRQRARALVVEVAARERRIARRYRRGRDRRMGRAGRHFTPFLHTTADGLEVRGVRFVDVVDTGIQAWAAEQLLAGPGAGEPLKAGGAVRAVTLPDGRAAVLKHQRASRRGRRARVLRAFHLAHALAHRHIPAAEAWLAAVDPTGAGVLLSRRVPGVDLHVATAHSGPFHALDAAARRLALRRLGRMLRQMHDADVSHRDLKLPNLVWHHDGAQDAFTIVDLDGARIRPGGVTWARRAKNLARLAASSPLPAVDAARVLGGYLAAGPTGDRAHRRAFARRIAEHVRIKRGPTQQPR